jgi:hypothetical protein
VCDDQLPVVENVVANSVVDECGDLLLELLGLALELRQRLRQPVGDLDVPPAQLAHELHVVVAGHAEGRP